MTVRPFFRQAHSVAKSMARVEHNIKVAAEDGVVTRQERKELNTQLKTAHDKAEGLVAEQGKPALRSLDIAHRLVNGGHIADVADDAARTLAQGRHAMWREVKAEAHENPFAHIGKGTRSPYHGVRTKDFSWEGHRVHMVAVDLANPNVRMQTTKPQERGSQLDDMTNRHRAEFGINGDFFSPGQGFATSGQAMHNGTTWGKPESSEGSLVFHGRHAELDSHSNRLPEFASNAVSARPVVLDNGKVITHYPEANKAQASRRTGVGLSKDGRLLLMVASETPMTARDLARFMKQHGAFDGMAMDSGGSAQLYDRRRGYVQRSSDAGGERRIANALLIQANKLH